MNPYLFIMFLSLILYGVILLYLLALVIWENIRKNKLKRQFQSDGVIESISNVKLKCEEEKTTHFIFGFKPSRVVISMTNVILGATAILALINVSLSNTISFRPYVSVTNMAVVSLNDTNKFSLHLTVTNTGNVPANNVRLSSQNIFNDIITGPSEPNTPIFIPPTKEGLDFEVKYQGDNIYKYIDGQNTWKIKVDIKYDGVYQKNLFTTATFQYNSQSKTFVMIDGNAQ